MRRTPTPNAIRLAALALGLLVAACGSEESPVVTEPSRTEVFDSLIAHFDLSALPPVPYPANNPPDPARIALGRLLFFDPILGGESAPWVKEAAGHDPWSFRENDVACATCHHPDLAFADGRRLSAGVSGGQFRDTDLGPDRVAPGRSIVTGDPVGIVPRNAPSILNTAFNGLDSPEPSARSFMFMDGRVTEGLEAQAILPITSRDEMAGDAYPGEEAQDSVVARLRAIPEYVARFTQAFPGEIESAEDIEIHHLGRALAAYERELVTPGSRYDHFVSGDYQVFDVQEQEGFEIFFGKGLCGPCHGGPMLSDYRMHVLGVADDYEAIHPGFPGKNGEGGDFGRFHADPDAFADQKYAFRSMTVRMVEKTAPYFHAGSARTLHEVMEFYNRGGRGPNDLSDAVLEANGVERHPLIRPLNLSRDEIDAVVAFMKTTTAEVRRGPGGIDLTAVPPRVPSGLVPPGLPTPPDEGPFLVRPPV